jgi:radical S-adenosyl methionine domain-containing protein 2
MNIHKLIILSGNAGSGKTTIGRHLARLLGHEFVSMGNFSRDHARNHHDMDINQFQEYCKAHPELDRKLDAWFVDDILARYQIGQGLVVDHRLGGHFFPWATSFFLHVSDSVAACRVASRKDETGETIEARNQKMRSRLQAAYSFDFTDPAKYRMIVNTDTLGELDVVKKILGFLASNRPKELMQRAIQ